MGISWQNKAIILERVVEHIQENEQSWKLIRKDDVKNGRAFQWQSGKQRVDISIVILATSEEAKAYLYNMINEVTVPYKSKMENLGDESVLYQSEGTTRSMLLMRRGTIFIHVNADEFTHGKKFAEYIIGLADSL
jgi:hypothetical protein